MSGSNDTQVNGQQARVLLHSLRETVSETEEMMSSLPLNSEQKVHFMSRAVSDTATRSSEIEHVQGKTKRSKLVREAHDFLRMELCASIAATIRELEERCSNLRKGRITPSAALSLSIVGDELAKIEATAHKAVHKAPRAARLDFNNAVHACVRADQNIKIVESSLQEPKKEPFWRKYLIEFLIALLVMLLGIPLTIWAEAARDEPRPLTGQSTIAVQAQPNSSEISGAKQPSIPH